MLEESRNKRKKLFWIAFAFIFSSFILFNVFVFFVAPHSEGLMMISDIGDRILGIDFAKKEFIYPRPREEKILPFLSVVKQDFFPYLKLKIIGVEVPILWKEYHGGLLAWLFKFLDKLLFFLGDFFKAEINILLFHFLFSFFFLHLLFKFFREYFFIDKFIVYSLIFCTMTSSIFYFLIETLHHAQATIFIFAMLYFLKERRYILAGLFAGLAVYSYLPIIYAVLGLTLASLLYHKNLKVVVFIGLFCLIFSSPHLYYILSSQNENFNQVYNCSNCVGLFPPTGLKYHIYNYNQFGIYGIFKILAYILVSLIFIPLKFFEISNLAFVELRKSFSISDVMIKYGAILYPPPFKYISDIGITLHLFVLFLGILYIRRRFELAAYFFSLIFYVLLSIHFMLLPKMLYFLFPIYVLVAVRVLNEFVLRKQKIMIFVFAISAVLRLAEFIHLGKNVRLIHLEANLEVINFFKYKDVKSEEILLYCFPPPFKIFTNGKINPPVFLPVFEKIDEFIREKTLEFVIEHSNFKYIVFDISFLRYFYKIISTENKKLDAKVVFRNSAFFIVEINRDN